jgi:hypothetical protein
LLAKDLGLEYKCVAVPGSGSDSHVRCVIENVDQDTKLVVVAWSYAHRFEFNFDELGWHGIWGCQKRPTDIRKIIEPLNLEFYSNMTERYQWYHYVKNIVFLQQWLTAKGIPYLFCNMDPDFNQRFIKVKDKAFRTLHGDINWDHWFFWKVGKETKGFRPWSIDMQSTDPKFEMGPGNHPLEHAHQASFNLIKQHLTHKGLYDTYRTSNYKT